MNDTAQSSIRNVAIVPCSLLSTSNVLDDGRDILRGLITGFQETFPGGILQRLVVRDGVGVESSARVCHLRQNDSAISQVGASACAIFHFFLGLNGNDRAAR